jgi:parallel beta-helix repeat protein
MDGIYAYYSDYNVFRTNSIINNGDYGIELSDSMYNLIYNNSFWYNHGSGDVYDSSHIQAYDDYINQWNTTTGYGNYWNDWTSPDDNGDGIVDDPYVVNLYSGYKDYYPRTTPSPGTDVPIPELSWMVLVVLFGAIVVIARKKH